MPDLNNIDYISNEYSTVSADQLSIQCLSPFELYITIDTNTGPVTPILSNITSSNNMITIVFDKEMALTGDSLDVNKWTFSPFLRTLNVSTSGVNVLVETSEQWDGYTYDIVIPSGIASIDGALWLGPFNDTFVGDGQNPFIANIYVIDARTIDVSFSEPVYPPDALTKENYSINNGLVVYSVEKVSETTYRLRTSKQVVGTSYLVTASNIRDLYGNVT